MSASSSDNDSMTLPQSWYPVCRSSDVKLKQVRLISLFDKQWVLYRTTKGEISALARYCCHMGVDLTCGRVEGEHLKYID